MTATRERRAALVLIGVLGAVVLAGAVTGTTLALWRHEESFTGELSTGVVGFAVERTDGAGIRSVSTGSGDAAEVRIGAAEARALVKDGGVAVPIQVDSLAQGRLGLRYEIRLPDFENGSILGAAEMAMAPIDEPAACTPHIHSLPPQLPLVSTPVPARYSDSAVPTTEYWCLLMMLEQAPIVGAYTNTGTVSGQWAGGEVEASDEWTTRVAADPALERDAIITFAHQTFRAVDS